jgi:D-alanyl-D-alanine carboxypeptidase/D-alanyl-D-alanine-endopeptidase (penicillin-binding protein 4)
MNDRRPLRRVVPIGMLVALGTVPALVLAGVWQYADANIPAPTTTTTTTLPPPPREELVTDLLSLRRHPAPLAQRVADAATEIAVAERVGALTAEINEGWCLRLLDADGVAIAEVDPLRPMIPASNQKLLVAAVALEVLGPDHRFRTELQSTPPTGGVIRGDVYLIGGGDPVLRSADVPDPLRYPSFNTTALEPLADKLVTLGVDTIDGDIVGDGSRYDDEFRAPSWGDDITNVDGGPYDALLVNDGLVGRGNYGLDPSRAAARVFYDLVEARGIMITGAAANAPRPPEADFTTLALVESLPLIDILVELLHTSDNNTAELLVKEIGFATTGEGTRVAGLAAIRSILSGWGIGTEGLELHDGSGLSRDNRVTCAVLAALLADAPVADELRELLPVAGRDGTLAAQFLGTEAEGRMQAKTGTLTDVKALSGSLPAGDRRRVDFALVLNGADVDDAAVHVPVWNRMVELIGDLPIVVEPDDEPFAPR